MNRVTLVRAPAGELPVAFPQVPPQWQPIGLVQLVVEAGYAWRAWQASVLARPTVSRKTTIFEERDARVLGWLRENDREGGRPSFEVRTALGMSDHEVQASLARLRDAGKLRHHVARKMWRVAHA